MEARLHLKITWFQGKTTQER